MRSAHALPEDNNFESEHSESLNLRSRNRHWPRELSRHVASESEHNTLGRSLTSQTENQLQESIMYAEDEVAKLKAEVTHLQEETARKKNLIALREHDIKSWKAQLSDIEKPREKRSVFSEAEYESIKFEWEERMMYHLHSVFKIEEFRLCQRAACNAVMDKRDVFCVMPTGGGKSLIYQLPAILQSGCTLVVSPLISLIADQVFHLRELGVEAIRIKGGKYSEEDREKKDALRRLSRLASGTLPDGMKPVKLCYVTPEMVCRSKEFKSVLSMLHEKGKLARIVIDEAHCVSELGYNFRPDYKELYVLRKLYPDVPILAISATCPQVVLIQVLKVLGMRSCASENGPISADNTLYFSSPLYRKNLHYAVLPKPEEHKKAIEVMADYILSFHSNDSGIIYCIRQKDSVRVAEELATISNGRIKTGVYHSSIDDNKKERLHEEWRRGNVKVVCATTAFGLGIDKADVRFVLHHAMPKSIESYYQESGRAGRDGKDSDCILYYRPQDCTSLLAITAKQQDAAEKVRSMAMFCQNLNKCRKLQFSERFSAFSQLKKSQWTTDELDSSSECGQCDNCNRPDAEKHEQDVTIEAWKILQAAAATSKPMTLKGLSVFCRGGNGAKKGNLSDTIGSFVKLRPHETDLLIIQLLAERLLVEKMVENEHTTIVYISPGQSKNAVAFSDTPLRNLPARFLMCAFMDHKKLPKLQGCEKKSGKKGRNQEVKEPTSKRSQGKRKRSALPDTSNSEADDEVEIPSDGEADLIARQLVVEMKDISEDDKDGNVIPGADNEWSYSMCNSPPRGKRRRRENSIEFVPDSEGEKKREPIDISSD